MTWVKIDDHFNEHPKLAAVGPVGWGIWLAGLAYCNRNLTDGFIPRAVAIGFGGDWTVEAAEERDGVPGYVTWDISRGTGMHGEDMDTSWVIDRLIEYGLWEPVSGGYRVHDYDDYQPTKAEVLAMRAAKAAAGQAGGRAAAKARAKAGAQAESNPVPVPVPVTSPSTTNGADFMEPWMLYEERTKRRATQKVRDWLEDLHARFSRRELIAAMQTTPDPKGTDWLKKVDAYLEGAA